MSDKEKLRQWLEEHGYSIAAFQRVMGYGSYAHAYQMLHGNGPLSDATIGRLARCLPDALFAIRDELRPCQSDQGDTVDSISPFPNGGASKLETEGAQ